MPRRKSKKSKKSKRKRRSTVSFKRIMPIVLIPVSSKGKKSVIRLPNPRVAAMKNARTSFDIVHPEPLRLRSKVTGAAADKETHLSSDTAIPGSVMAMIELGSLKFPMGVQATDKQKGLLTPADLDGANTVQVLATDAVGQQLGVLDYAAMYAAYIVEKEELQLDFINHENFPVFCGVYLEIGGLDLGIADSSMTGATVGFPAIDAVWDTPPSIEYLKTLPNFQHWIIPAAKQDRGRIPVQQKIDQSTGVVTYIDPDNEEGITTMTATAVGNSRQSLAVVAHKKVKFNLIKIYEKMAQAAYGTKEIDYTNLKGVLSETYGSITRPIIANGDGTGLRLWLIARPATSGIDHDKGTSTQNDDQERQNTMHVSDYGTSKVGIMSTRFAVRVGRRQHVLLLDPKADNRASTTLNFNY